MLRGALSRIMRLLGPTILRARMRRRRLKPGFTVVSVSHNSEQYIPYLIEAIKRHTDPSPPLLVIDNDSTDNTVLLLRDAGAKVVRLPRNWGHAQALDFGLLLCETEYALILDIDAFPIASGWADAVLRPLASGVAELAGGHLPAELTRHLTDYVHPCYCALRPKDFARWGKSFRHGEDWDVGEALTKGRSVHYIEATSVRGPSAVGTVFGDLVYHNFYSTRPAARMVIMDIPDGEPESAWSEAIERYFDPA